MSGAWELRPAGPEDLEAVAAVYRAEDMRYRGRSEVSASILAERGAADSGFDALHDQVVADLDGRVVAAAILRSRAGFLAVEPGLDLPGLRANLLSWMEWRWAQRSGQSIRVSVPATTTPTVTLLGARGYALERFYAEMVRDFASTGAPEPAAPPSGFRMRAIDRERDLPGLHRLDDRAFADRPDYQPESVEEYGAHLGSSLFMASWSFLVETVDGELAGSLIAKRRDGDDGGYVEILAVDPDQRRRGLARSLLLAALGAIQSDGRPRAALHVASDNPRALDLYRGVGMLEGERIEDYVRTLG